MPVSDDRERTLSEHESKRFLAEFGIPSGPERVVDSPEAAVDAARELGLPVVVKLCGETIAHKSERNLVRLNLVDDASVRVAAEDLLAARGSEEADADTVTRLNITGKL